MNQYVTGAVIKELREKKNMTQAEFAQRLCVSAKTISKWETAKGYPDISLLEPIASVLGVSVTELISGNTVSNGNVSANILRSKFYVCPVCGNIVHSMGESVIQCHGILLTPCQAEETDEKHMIFVERVEDEYYVRIEHEMTKQHYITFVATLSADKLQMIKLYPEGNAEARFKINGVKRILFYCNRDGLFTINVMKGIDDKQASYDDVEECRALELTAEKLFKIL
ncbi:MAG: helix-turn-helix domain-containing protein [Lachnospiraceae bacterium]|nr:helix-turn-helix domain-containing protein [Lachnospiraceae bacterium]MBR4084017.1 helix-turn-helix domain-containing protein [Lachnospiraceae bacterium]